MSSGVVFTLISWPVEVFRNRGTCAILPLYRAVPCESRKPVHRIEIASVRNEEHRL